MIISFVIMLLVYIYLPRRADRQKRKQSTVRAVDNVDPMDIQMVELIDKAPVGSVDPVPLPVHLERVESAKSSLDQQVTHFDFHRADD